MSFEDQLYSILSNCDKDQLNKYMNDDEAADLLVASFEQYQELVAEKEHLEKLNKSTAERNLELEPTLENLKLKLRQAIGSFEKAKQEYLSLREASEMSAADGSNMSLSSISTALENRAQRDEEETDRQADEFFCVMNSLKSEEELNNFQRQFLEARALAHIKKIKAEKMKELTSRH